MTGTVTANAGAIGGFEISSTKINSTNDKLILSSSGDITGSSVLFTGGKIGGWDIGGSTIAAGSTIELNAAGGGTGTIRIGTGFGPTSPTNDTAGVYLAGDGGWAFVFDANNRMYYDGRLI